ncbi:MAG TPA: type II CAAX endopeptidase family protein [Thermomicrobiales bacterium]|nr:type II CAAX endopeptidase family protein [Thermomicrobiales bacterium]
MAQTRDLPRPRPARLIVAGYVAAIVAAEAAGAYWGVIPGLIGDALILEALLVQYQRLARPDGAACRPLARALPALALVPLLRILSVALPTPLLPRLAWYPLIGVPLLLGVGLAARFLGCSWSALGLRPRAWGRQALIAASGAPLGLLAYALAPAPPLVATLGWRDVVAGVLILLVFVGFAEELLFRGLLRLVAGDIFGPAAVVWTSTLFAAMYIGTRSPLAVLFMGGVGLLFGYWVERTGSLWGVVLAHGLLATGAVLIWPVLLR